MPLNNPARQLDAVSIADVASLLLRQFKSLLAARGQDLSQQQIQEVAADMASRRSISPPLVAAMKDIVTESLTLLQTRWGLSFSQSLASDMSAIGGWDTTEEFLNIANEKSNAELRIAAGSAVLVMMGETSYARYLYDVIEDDGGIFDIDATIARRALLHAADLSFDVEDALEQARARLLP